jgi:predicted nucleic acid-binding Zn ribbon protein
MDTELKNQQLPLNITGAAPSGANEGYSPFCGATAALPAAVANGITGDSHSSADITAKSGPDSPSGPATLFNDARDNVMIATGTHFFCRGHLRAVPIETQSSNPDYCNGCLEIIIEERRRDKDVDLWQGEIFIHHNKRYTIHSAKNSKETLTEIKTYCLGSSKPQPLSEEITTTLLQPVKVPAPSRTTTPDIVTVNSGRKCLVCGKLITWGNSRVKYCSDPCQKKAHLMRKAATA